MITTLMVKGLAPHKRQMFNTEAKKVWAEFAVKTKDGVTDAHEEAYDLEIKEIFEKVQAL